MPSHNLLRTFKATSASASVLKDKPKSAALNFCLSSGEFLRVELSRLALTRLSAQIDKAIQRAPIPPGGRSRAASSEGRQSK
jgi:hypothetical protein